MNNKMNSLTKLSTPQKAPSTPAAQTTPSTPQTGTWQHPRLKEITRRQNASTFSEKNLNSVIYNVAALFGCYVLEKIIASEFPSVFYALQPLQPYDGYVYAAIRIIFIINIVVALWPLFWPKDTLNDIPLTPAQRSLLGLPASTGPPTPGSTYATPPRYAPSPASRSANRSTNNTPIRSSPLSFTPLGGSPRNATTMGQSDTPTKGRDSPFSPTQASPLLHKTFANQSRGYSPGQSMFGRISEGPGTPSPSTGKSSVPLNNKWLYEKGRTSQGAGGRLFRD